MVLAEQLASVLWCSAAAPARRHCGLPEQGNLALYCQQPEQAPPHLSHPPLVCGITHRVQEVQVPQGGSPGLGRPAFCGAALHGVSV